MTRAGIGSCGGSNGFSTTEALRPTWHRDAIAIAPRARSVRRLVRTASFRTVRGWRSAMLHRPGRPFCETISARLRMDVIAAKVVEQA